MHTNLVSDSTADGEASSLKTASSWWARPLIACLVLGQFLFEPWWRFPLATLGILLIAQIGYGQKSWQRLGLAMPIWHFAGALGLLGAIYGLSAWSLPYLASLQNLRYEPYVGSAALFWQAGLLFQVLNEEMLLRALLLFWLKRRLRSEVLIMLITLVVFAGLHILLYLFLSDVSLNLGTLVTLIAYCQIANLLVLRSGHIAFAFAIHAGWNLNRFTAGFFVGNQRLSEAQSFNVVEGRIWPWMLGFWLILACCLRTRPDKSS